MTKPTDIRVLDAQFQTETISYRTPIKFGGRVVTEATIANVTLGVETRDGRRGRGFGSMPLGNAWAWPSKLLSGEQTLAAMERLAAQAVQSAVGPEYGHPLELTHDLAKLHQTLADKVAQELQLPEPMSKLAILVAASPTEAALHDAYGKTLGENSYNLLGKEFVNRDLGSYLGNDFAGEYLDRYTLRQPKAKMPLYHLVGALDPLTAADITQRIVDGLPETLPEWIVADGLTHLKIKLAGDDLAWDVARVLAIEQIAAQTQAQRGVSQWSYSCDFNEKCENVEYVLAFLAQINEQSPPAWQRIQYIEQPTSRDLQAHPENRMHQAAAIKPVVIDEALVDFESLLLAREQGYSGVALKACKGHTEALLAGAAAQRFGMFLCVQDLTCPGYSFLHSASLAARIPTIAAIEGNSRQYCPAGNNEWAARFPGMFEITDGTVATGCLNGPGLGF
jgi:L-alanine-DL-glutamate epimerase-like enolase superfamily enzyme